MPLYGITAAEFREYALAGSPSVDLSAYSDDDCLRLLTGANRFVNSQDDKLIGTRTDRDQPDAYPRRDLRINGHSFADDEIPAIVKEVVMAFALETHAGIDIFTGGSEMPVKREKVGIIEVEYAVPQTGVAGMTERQSLAMNLFRQLCRGKRAAIASIEMVRV